MTQTQQPEALRLARKFEEIGFMGDHHFAKDHWCRQAAAELRSQHARIAELEAQLSTIGAGGVEPLRKPVVQAPAHPAEGVPAQAVYAEARECNHCNHVGINDSADDIATCTECQWSGGSPKEDKCPACEAEGTMTASCPKCHHEYRLLADATLAATLPAAPETTADDAKRYRWLRDANKADFEHEGFTSSEIDAAIDAALAAQAKQGGQANG